MSYVEFGDGAATIAYRFGLSLVFGTAAFGSRFFIRTLVLLDFLMLSTFHFIRGMSSELAGE